MLRNSNKNLALCGRCKKNGNKNIPLGGMMVDKTMNNFFFFLFLQKSVGMLLWTLGRREASAGVVAAISTPQRRLGMRFACRAAKMVGDTNSDSFLCPENGSRLVVASTREALRGQCRSSSSASRADSFASITIVPGTSNYTVDLKGAVVCMILRNGKVLYESIGDDHDQCSTITARCGDLLAVVTRPAVNVLLSDELLKLTITAADVEGMAEVILRSSGRALGSTALIGVVATQSIFGCLQPPEEFLQ